MNRKNAGVIYTAAVCILLILIILTGFLDAVLGEKTPKKQAEISVILYDAGSNGWESLLRGMKQAEDDFSVNINYAVMRKDEGGEEQLELIRREIENGVQGIIVAVCDYESMYEELESISNAVPMVAVESGVGDSMISLFSADNYQMGRKLGEEILKDFREKESLTVALIRDNVRRDSVLQREEGLRDALGEKAKIVSLQAAMKGEKIDAAVGLHKESLLSLTERNDAALDDVKKYGIGNTAAIVTALDKGCLDKLVFQNEFNMGYLAVEALLENISGNGCETTKNIDDYCISRDEVFETQYERLLFPIVE